MADSYRTRGSDGRLFKEHDNADGTFSDAVHIQSATAAIDVDLDIEAADLGARAEDSAHSTGHAGMYVLGVSAATPTATAGAAGDYQGLSVSSTTGDLFTKDTGATALLTTIDADTGDIVTAVQVMDDWDETDRAKVNIIAGQAGVAAGAGVVDALTQRATLASDDPAVVALQIIDDWDEANRAAVNPIAGQIGVAAGTGVLDALTQRVTIATDDEVNNLLGTIDADTGNIATYTTDIPNVIGTDGAAGPTKAVSVAGTQATGELQEIQVDGDGHLQIDVLTAPSTAVTNAGTFAVQASVTPVTSVGTETVQVNAATVVAAAYSVLDATATGGQRWALVNVKCNKAHTVDFWGDSADFAAITNAHRIKDYTSSGNADNSSSGGDSYYVLCAGHAFFGARVQNNDGAANATVTVSVSFFD